MPDQRQNTGCNKVGGRNFFFLFCFGLPWIFRGHFPLLSLLFVSIAFILPCFISIVQSRFFFLFLYYLLVFAFDFLILFFSTSLFRLVTFLCYHLIFFFEFRFDTLFSSPLLLYSPVIFLLPLFCTSYAVICVVHSIIFCCLRSLFLSTFTFTSSSLFCFCEFAFCAVLGVLVAARWSTFIYSTIYI